MRLLFKNKHFVYPFVCWVLVCLWFSFFSLGAFDGLRLKMDDIFDHLQVISKSYTDYDKNVVVVAVDNESLADASMKWPWKRSYFADLLNKINKDNPKVIGFDFIFSGASERSEDDAALEAAIKKSDNVFLAYDRQSGRKALFPLERFRNSAVGYGYVNKPVTNDSIVRKIRLFMKEDKALFYPFELQIASFFEGVDLNTIEYKNNHLYVGADRIISLEDNGIISLNYSYDYISYKTISARRVLKGDVPAGFFTGKIVLVGATAKIIHDEIPTPLGVFPGVYVLANTLTMLINSSFVNYLPVILDVLMIAVLGFLVLMFNRKRGFIRGFIAMLAIAVMWIALMFFARRIGYRFDYCAQAFLIISAYLLSNIYKYCYLIYISNKLKNQAVADPVTGFYTTRYFMLLLAQKIQAREKDISLIAVGVREYQALSKEYGFEEMKGFVRGFARFLEIQLKSEVKKVIFSRSTEGRFFMLVSNYSREKLRILLDDVMHKVWESGFSFGEDVKMIHLSSVIAFSPVYHGVTARRMFYRAQEALDDSIVRKSDSINSINIHEKVWDVDKAEATEDELEFLSVDIEERNAELEKALKMAEDSQKGAEKAYFDVVLTLVKALEEKDTFTQGHSDRCAKYARAIAKEAGLSEEECELIYKAGLLHDIGKIGIPETILHKKGRLTDEDFGMIKRHPVMGNKILEPIKVFGPLLPMVLHHHEKYDGTGYPHGLHGDVIPVGAQILAVADCFDAITCGRGYKQGASLRDGMEELERCAGTQFNPEYVEAFKRVLKMK